MRHLFALPLAFLKSGYHNKAFILALVAFAVIAFVVYKANIPEADDVRAYINELTEAEEITSKQEPL